MKPFNIHISGVGGQGIIKTSIIMGEAAMNTGEPVVMSEIHGMAQRGGVVSTELRIGSSNSPIIMDGHADLLIAFEPIEALRAISKLRENGCIITDKNPIIPFNIKQSEYSYPDISTVIDELRSKSNELYVLDAIKIAKKAGNVRSANMVMLGGAAAVPGFPLTKDVLIEAMKDNLPEESLDINISAFEKGFMSIHE